MASIQKRGSTYRARVIRRGYPTQSKTFNTRIEATKWARGIEAQIDEGSFRDLRRQAPCILDEIVSFPDATNRYIETHSIHKKNFRSESGILKTLAKRWMHKTVVEVNKQEVLALRNELVSLGRSGDTINHYFNAISKLYQMLADELSLDVTNPTTAIKRMPQSKGRNKRLTGEAEVLFFECCAKTHPPQLLNIVKLAIETGMRRGELMNVQWSDVDQQHRRIYLNKTKNGESRQVPLTLKAVEIINNLKAQGIVSEKIFLCSLPSLRKGFHNARKKALSEWSGRGRNPFEDFRFHDLRHEALSRLSDGGLNAIELAHISGHKTLAMLKRYTHPSHQAIFDKLDKKHIQNFKKD